MTANKQITQWGKITYTIDNQGFDYLIAVSGRDRWALEALMQQGAKGCTPITQPAPRWSAYVYNLRKMGVGIVTLTEPHDGPFKGTHARYVLQSIVMPVPTGEVAA